MLLRIFILLLIYLFALLFFCFLFFIVGGALKSKFKAADWFASNPNVLAVWEKITLGSLPVFFVYFLIGILLGGFNSNLTSMDPVKIGYWAGDKVDYEFNSVTAQFKFNVIDRTTGNPLEDVKFVAGENALECNEIKMQSSGIYQGSLRVLKENNGFCTIYILKQGYKTDSISVATTSAINEERIGLIKGSSEIIKAFQMGQDKKLLCE